MPLDIGMGILLALGVSQVFEVPLTPFLIMFGIASALLPDIDVVTALFGRWRHREITHYPILYLPLIALSFLFLALPLATLLTLGVAWHFIHDSVGTGWGIAWLWPFSQRRFLLLPDGDRRRTMGTFATWLPEERPEYAHHGPHAAWVRAVYARPSATALIEYSLLALALIVLAIYVW